MNVLKKYFFIVGIILINNSLFASQASAGSKAAVPVQSATQILANAQPSAAGAAAAGSSEAAAATNVIDKQEHENEYDVKVTAEHAVSTITKKTVLTHNPTGQRLEEIIVFSKKAYKTNPFEQILSSKIEGSRALYPILTVYKEGLLLHRIKHFTQLAAANGSQVDLSNFSHGASNSTFDFKNPPKKEEA